MASDNSPTRNGIIVAIAAGTVVALVGIKFGLDSYFISMTEQTAHEKLVSPEQLILHREAEKKALVAGSMPIESAMSEMTRRGRDTLSGNGVDLTPRQSEDTGPLTGWSKMPKAIPAKPVAPTTPVVPAQDGPIDPHAANAPPTDPNHIHVGPSAPPGAPGSPAVLAAPHATAAHPTPAAPPGVPPAPHP
jgi:hypothetical protein